MTSVNFSPEAKAGEGRKGFAFFLHSIGERVRKERTKMYKIVTKEDTIRIPAEYMKKGQSLDQHIDRLAMTHSKVDLMTRTDSFWSQATTHLSAVDESFTAMERFTSEFDSTLFSFAWMITKLLKVQFQKSMNSVRSFELDQWKLSPQVTNS